MILDDVVLYDKLLQLRDSGAKPVHWRWEAEIIINDRTITVFNVMDLTRVSEFAARHFDILVVTLQVKASDLIQYILPNKAGLRVTLSKIPTSKSGDSPRVGEKLVQTFNAYIPNVSSPNIKTASGRSTGGALDDMGELLEIDLQLVEPEYAEFRLIEIAGIYRTVNLSDLLLGLMTQPLAVKGEESIGVDMVPADNTREYFQLAIPNGTRLLNLPEYLQRDYGVYASKIGWYMHRGLWYIYPLLDYNRFTLGKSTLTMLVVPQDEMSGNDNSYIQEGNDLFVFATGDKEHKDYSEHRLQTVGNGYRHSLMSNLMDKFRDHAGGISTVPEGRNLVQVIAEERPTGLNNIRTAEGLFTDNPFSESSDITSGLGGVVVLNWEFSNPELLYPGMPCKIIYKAKSKATSLKASLIKAESHIQTEQSSPTDNRYVTSTVLTFHTEREILE